MTEEERERLKQIRERHRLAAFAYKGDKPPIAVSDIDFLLSLLNSQAALSRELAMIVDVGTSDDPGTALATIRKIRSDAATAMRDACVEKVKAMREQHTRDYEYWKSVSSNPDTDFGVLKFAAWAGEDERVIAALESLTLDQVEQEKQS